MDDTDLSNEGRYVIAQLMPEWEVYFRSKQLDYKNDGNTFGAKGIIPDIDRKAKKIRRAIWDGEHLVGEQPRELLLDLIGHCFLTITEIDKAYQHNLTGEARAKIVSNSSAPEHHENKEV